MSGLLRVATTTVFELINLVVDMIPTAIDRRASLAAPPGFASVKRSLPQ